MSDDRIGTLSDLLWRERRLLEVLAFRLEVQRLMVVAGKGRHLVQAAHDVEEALGDIRTSELERAGLVERVAADLGLPPGPTLQQIAAVADEPWASLLADHRDSLAGLRVEIDILKRSVVSLTELDLERLERRRARIVEHMSASGDRRTRDPQGSRLEDIEWQLQEAASESALADADRLLQRSLADFLA